MTKRQKARLALEILNESQREHPYTVLTDQQLDEKADEIIKFVYDELMDKGAKLIRESQRLGFSNKEIAEKINCEESILSRVHKRSDELQISLSTLRDLVKDLKAFLASGKVRRIRQSVSTPSIVALDFCPRGEVSDDDKRMAAQVVVTNLIRSLSGNSIQRVALPLNIRGVLLRIGSWEDGLRVYQSAGNDDDEILAHEIHELEHMIRRMKDTLAANLKKRGKDKPGQKPKGLF
jgi:hypothetical protein